MTWVKVCGLRRDSDVDVAVEAGASAVGLVLAPNSPRFIPVSQAATLGVDSSVLRVIVTVDLTPHELLTAVAATGAGGVQPHGLHRVKAAQAAQGEGLFVLHPVPVVDTVEVDGVPDGQTPLLDNYQPGAHGGTGQAFDWGVIPDLARPFVLAGGLEPDNVAEAIRQVAPWGVDASSGLESSPGVKDPDRIRMFVERALDR